MKFECPECKKSGQVDDTRVPESGVYATCPQCNNRFLVKREVPKDFKFEPVEPAIQKVQSDTTSAQNASSGEPSKSKTNASPNTTDDIAYYKAAIGKNFEKYIDVIKAIQVGKNEPLSWHWPAFLLGAPWLLFRKMYGVFFLYLFAAIILDLMANFKPELGLFFIGLSAVFAVYAKSIYVKHVSKKIESCGQMPHADKINKLQADCGTNTWIYYFGAISVIGIIAAIAIPQFSAYRERAYKKAAAQSPNTFIDPYDPAPTQKTVPAVGTPISLETEWANAKPYSGFIFDSQLPDCGVTDPKSGLMWTRNGNITGNQMDWDGAVNWVNKLNYGGFNGWSLPSKEEFESFAQQGGNLPYEWFNGNGFNNVQSGGYWTRSANPRKPNDIWYVNMDDGVAYSTSKFSLNYAWAVGRR